MSSLSMHHCERDHARAALHDIAQEAGWFCYGYKEDKTDSMVDYFDPADWYGYGVKYDEQSGMQRGFILTPGYILRHNLVETESLAKALEGHLKAYPMKKRSSWILIRFEIHPQGSTSMETVREGTGLYSSREADRGKADYYEKYKAPARRVFERAEKEIASWLKKNPQPVGDPPAAEEPTSAPELKVIEGTRPSFEEQAKEAADLAKAVSQQGGEAHTWVAITFPEIPNAELRQRLKDAGFIWDRKNRVWSGPGLLS